MSSIGFPGLPVVIERHIGTPPPHRKLELQCRVSNPADFDIYILDAWIKVVALSGLLLAEGRIFQPLNNRVDAAIIPAGKQGIGSFHIELPAEVMHHIEQRRSGGDINLSIQSRVIASEISTASEKSVLRPPYETEFNNGGAGHVDYLIAQSEWLKLLKAMAWSELIILELPNGARNIAHLARAFERFVDAQQNYRNGDWDETLMNCRKAFEALVQDATGKTEMSNAPQVFASFLGTGEKVERFNKLAKSLGDFLHLGRHETLPKVSITRSDAEFALSLTGALLGYLSR